MLYHIPQAPDILPFPLHPVSGSKLTFLTTFFASLPLSSLLLLASSTSLTFPLPSSNTPLPTSTALKLRNSSARAKSLSSGAGVADVRVMAEVGARRDRASVEG